MSRLFIEAGRNRSAKLSAALLAGVREIELGAGEHELETPLLASLIASEGALDIVGRGAQKTFIIPTYPPPSVTAADDPTNAMFRFTGTFTTWSGVLASPAIPWTTTLSLVAAGTLQPGDWIWLSGHNTTSEQNLLSSGANIILTEIVQVASTYTPGSLTVPLTAPIVQYHATNVALRGWAPLPPLVLAGMSFVAAGDTVANALTMEGCRTIGLYDLECEGFSRTGFELRGGCRDARLQNLQSRGEVNCLVRLDSAVRVRGQGFYSRADGKRFHAHGIPRGLISLYQRSSEVHLSEGVLQRGCVGIRCVGGVGLSFENFTIADFDCNEALVRDPILYGPKAGVGIDMGVGPVPDNEQGVNAKWDDIRVVCCVGRDGDPLQFAIWWHDFKETFWDNISIENPGPGPASGHWLNGFGSQDVTGGMGVLTVNGVNFALVPSGGQNGYSVECLRYQGVPGTGPNGNYGIVPKWNTPNTGPRIRRYDAVNAFAPFYFGDPSFVPDYNYGHEVYSDGNGNTWTDTILAKNTTGGPVNPGDLVEIAGTGTRDVVASGAPSRKNAVVVWGAADGALILIAPLQTRLASVMATAAAVAPGDLVASVVGAPGFVAANNAVPPYLACGRALFPKAAGAPGMIVIGLSE